MSKEQIISFNKLAPLNRIEGIIYHPALTNNKEDQKELNKCMEVYIEPNIVDSTITYSICKLDGKEPDKPTFINKYDKFEDALEETQKLNNVKLSGKNKYFTIKNGLVVNSNGVYINEVGNRIPDSDEESIPLEDKIIKMIQCFVNCVLNERNGINNVDGNSSYLKTKVEAFLKKYFPHEYKDITHGAVIVALDREGFNTKYTNGKYVSLYNRSLKSYMSDLNKDIYKDAVQKFKQNNL